MKIYEGKGGRYVTFEKVQPSGNCNACDGDEVDLDEVDLDEGEGE